jgi:hypothetical protein
MSCQEHYTAMLCRILSMSRAFRALPRLPCTPPPKLDGYEALMRSGHSAPAPERAALARVVALVFVEDLRTLTPAQRSEALTGSAGHAALMTDAWALEAGSAWADYATLLAVLAESPTPTATLLHLAETEPEAFWTQVWRWLLMQHASYSGGYIQDDERVNQFQAWLCADVLPLAHPNARAWALLDEERRRCASLGLLLNTQAITRLLPATASEGLCRFKGGDPPAKRGRSASS